MSSLLALSLFTTVLLVRCPKCQQFLPELPDFQVYRCGGCGATLEVKVLSLQQSQSLQTSQSWRSSHYSSGSDSVPLLGNGSHDDNSDYDDQHYLTTGSGDSNLGDYDELGNAASIVGSDVFNPLVSTDYDDSGNLASAAGPSGSNPPGSVVINIGLEVENNDPHHRTRVTSVELTFILVGFILEMLSAGFDQVSSASKPLYALISLLLAIAAVLTCILELIYNGIKDKDASPNRPVFGTLLAIFGLGLAVIQCVCSAVQYYCCAEASTNCE